MHSADAILAQLMVSQSRATPTVRAGLAPDEARQAAGEFEQFLPGKRVGCFPCPVIHAVDNVYPI